LFERLLEAVAESDDGLVAAAERRLAEIAAACHHRDEFLKQQRTSPKSISRVLLLAPFR
jgi:hypothetical protein